MAPDTFAIEYCTVELQMLLSGPVILPGWPGMLLPTVLHLGMLFPHGPAAATHTDGAPVYGAGKFTVMLLVPVPVAMVAPAGTVQL